MTAGGGRGGGGVGSALVVSPPRTLDAELEAATLARFRTRLGEALTEFGTETLTLG